MATKKNNVKKAVEEKSTMIKIAEKIGEVAGSIAVKKDQLVEMASGAIETVKTTINNITAPKKATVKKTVKKAIKKVAKKAKPVAKKVAKAAVKKAAPVKKAIKKVVKKAPAVKKTIKKVIKKAAKKAPGRKR